MTTGWTCLTLNIAHLSWQDKWDFLTKYSDNFVWSPRTLEDHVPGLSVSNIFARANLVTVCLTRRYIYLHFQAERSESVRNNTKSNETLRLLAQDGKPQPVTLFLQLRDMREHGNDVIPGISPCWDHAIHVVQSRDIPLNPKDVRMGHRYKFSPQLFFFFRDKIILCLPSKKITCMYNVYKPTVRN